MKKKLNMIIASCISAVVVFVSLLVCAIVFKPNNDEFAGIVTPTIGEEVGGIYFATTAENTGAVDAPSDMKGGAIYLEPGSKFVMSNGSIEDHEGYFGGAVYISNGASFTLNGGNISYNYSMYGGAIYVEKGGVLRINGGSITNNQAQVAPAIYMEAGAELYLDGQASNIKTNEYTEFSPVTVNYYVDGVIENSATQSVCVLNMSNAPLDYNNCPGYYLDPECTQEVERGEQISLNDGGSGVLTSLNLYTKKATLSKLSFSVLTDTNTNEEYCSVYAPNSSISGDVVIPKLYNDVMVTFVAGNAFKNTGITSCFMPEAIDYIGPYAFSHAESLTSVNLTNSLIDIYYNAFEYTAIKSIHIPKSIEYIGPYAFANSALETVTSDPSARLVSYTSTGIFRDCANLNDISKLYIFEGGEIPDYTFYNCSSLVEVDIDEVEIIGQCAFAYCSSLKVVGIEAEVRYIKEQAFYECTNITDIYYYASFLTCPEPVIDSDGYANGIFAGLGAGKNVTLHIGSRVMYIADNLFYVTDHNPDDSGNNYYVKIDKVEFEYPDIQGREYPLFLGDNCFRNTSFNSEWCDEIFTTLLYENVIQGFGKGAMQDSSGITFMYGSQGYYYQEEDTRNYITDGGTNEVVLDLLSQNNGFSCIGEYLAFGGYEYAYFWAELESDSELMAVLTIIYDYKDEIENA